MSKYIAIRPRPDSNSAITASDVEQTLLSSRVFRLRNRYTGCFISKCQIKNCKLSTHRQWIATTSTDKQNATKAAVEAAITLSDGLLNSDSMLDALPPLPGLEGSEVKRLFHLFFAYDFPRITALLQPPPMTDSARQSIEAFRRDSLERSLTSPIYCHMYVASAHLHELTRKNDLSPSRISAVLRGKLLQLMRQKLNAFKRAEIENIISVMLTLVQFDLALSQHIVLDSHRSALRHLVIKQGGIHNLGHTLHYALTLDRILATYTAKPPIFAEMVDRKFLRPPKVPPVYGVNLEARECRTNIDQEVSDFCYDVCRAVEIVEHEKWTFEPGREDGTYDAGQVQYLYFLKYQIHTAFAHLQSRQFAITKTSMPILLAANIVAYLILQINYMPAFTRFLSDRLRSYLEEQQLPRDWSKCEDILRWVLCVLLSTSKCWRGRAWAQSCLFDLLEREYGRSGWPQSWISDELSNARKCVWSDRLDKDLLSALSQLEHSRSSEDDNSRPDTRSSKECCTNPRHV